MTASAGPPVTSLRLNLKHQRRCFPAGSPEEREEEALAKTRET
jgi:hypothetical protein